MHNSVPERATLSTEDNLIASQTLDGGWSGQLTVSRRRAFNPKHNPDLIFVDSEHLGHLALTREQAADLAEAMRDVSGMETSTRGARNMAKIVRRDMRRHGVSKRAVMAATGISQRRLDKLFAGSVPWTREEAEAISEVVPV